jgi:hypothetical protein
MWVTTRLEGLGYFQTVPAGQNPEGSPGIYGKPTSEADGRNVDPKAAPALFLALAAAGFLRPALNQYPLLNRK